MGAGAHEAPKVKAGRDLTLCTANQLCRLPVANGGKPLCSLRLLAGGGNSKIETVG